jgi:hypothetical protein
MRAELLAPEAAGKANLIAVRPDKAVWHPVHAAYHESIFVKLAKPVIVQGAHNTGSKALSQEILALSDVFPGSGHKFPLFFMRPGTYSLPKISPFYISMVLEIAVTAIVRTSSAGEADLVRRLVVCLLHLEIELGQLSKQSAAQWSLL